MQDLKKVINQYSIKYDAKIKKICAPLLNCLEIPFFSYYKIDLDGRFGTLTSAPEALECYFETKQYLINPYLSDPRLFRSGYAISPFTFDAKYRDIMHKTFSIYHLFVMLYQKGESVEGFLFANHSPDRLHALEYISKLDLLQKFNSYFKRETKNLFRDVMEEDFNLKLAKGDSFFAPAPSIPLLNNPISEEFLKRIAPLSPQERRCLELFKQGNSSQATAAILGLSCRTVEFYFENIKNKLGCMSKWDLLQW